MNEEAQQPDRERNAARKRYNRIVRFYNLLELLDERRFRPWRTKLLARSAGRVLEVGVGTGKNFPIYPAGVAVTAIDVAENMLAAARKKAGRQGFFAEWTRADVQNLPFRGDTFDTTAATFVFCSVPDPLRGPRELRRVVKPRGPLAWERDEAACRCSAARLGRLVRRGCRMVSRRPGASTRGCGLHSEIS
jgi:ubiquinone/menaquinone biosynthesis C-methylase UbiE